MPTYKLNKKLPMDAMRETQGACGRRMAVLQDHMGCMLL